ncbi:hypothetical protein ACVW0Y_001266 [Pseudomonas sp. TE3786]
MSGSPLHAAPVPERYLGVWQRTLLTTTAGKHDTSTQVYWLQTARLFADLRIPQPAPKTSWELANQGGFAGITEVTRTASGEERCQWHRAVDFQPPRASEDIGRMLFERPDCVLEDGLDDSYHEVWERLPHSIGRNWGTWLHAADGRQGCLLLAGDCFLFVASRPAPLPAASSLAELLDGSSHQQQLLDCELSFGRHQYGRRPWHIELSTLPQRIGQSLLPEIVDPDRSEQLCAADTLALLGHTPAQGGWHLRDTPLFSSNEEAL